MFQVQRLRFQHVSNEVEKLSSHLLGQVWVPDWRCNDKASPDVERLDDAEDLLVSCLVQIVLPEEAEQSLEGLRNLPEGLQTVE